MVCFEISKRNGIFKVINNKCSIKKGINKLYPAPSIFNITNNTSYTSINLKHHHFISRIGGYKTLDSVIPVNILYSLNNDKTYLLPPLPKQVGYGYTLYSYHHDMIFVVGGFNTLDSNALQALHLNFKNYKDFNIIDGLQLYNLQWKLLANLDRSKSNTSCIFVGQNDQHIVSIGGYHYSTYQPTCEIYNIKENKWGYIQPMPYRTGKSGVFKWENKNDNIIVIGGKIKNNGCCSYNFHKNKWSSLPNTINSYDHYPTITSNDNNSVMYVMNSFNNHKTSYNKIEYYDIRDNIKTWRNYCNISDIFPDYNNSCPTCVLPF